MATDGGAGDYALLNCLVRLPAIDVERSDVALGERSGIITAARRLAFHPEVVRGHPVFTSELARTWLFVDESVADAVTRHGLTGFRLTEVWSETGGPVEIPPTRVSGPPEWHRQIDEERRRKREAFLLAERALGA